MGEKAAPIARIGGASRPSSEIRELRTALRAHEAEDRQAHDETGSAIAEIRTKVDGVARVQKVMSEDQQTILRALGLAAAHGHPKRRRARPVAMMNTWEFIFKFGGAFGGLVLLLKMAEAAAPSVWFGAKGLAVGLLHALQAVNHVATG